MRHQGSKKNISPLINRIVQNNITNNEWYIEPFGGGMNAIAYVDYPKKMANDFNPYTIAFWRAIRNGKFTRKMHEFCKNITKEQYYDIKNDYLTNGGKYPKALIGYVGFACSNGSAWWNGYANYNEKRGENHVLEAYNNMTKQLKEYKYLKETIFSCKSYEDLEIPENSFIYCDPPYQDTKGYNINPKGNNNFDNEKFWNWCREQVAKGNRVLVSEYNAPEDFVCVWEQEQKNNMSTNNIGKRVEKLFVHKSQLGIIKI